MNKSAIGIFDSGLGGLTVAREIAQSLKSEDIIYLGDTARCPYGPKDPKDVERFVIEICSFFVEQNVKLIVIACNTATAAGLATAQKMFDIPIIGVVEPGARAAVRATRNRRVGVIGTDGTIKSESYSKAVRALDAGVTVFSLATPQFVEIVEEGLVFDKDMEGTELSEVYIRSDFYKTARAYLDPLRAAEIDTLILGCTHFPLLATAIGQVMGPRVELISSAEETACEVSETLARRENLNDTEREPEYRFFTTGNAKDFERLGSKIFGPKLKNVEEISLNKLQEFSRALKEKPVKNPAPQGVINPKSFEKTLLTAQVETEDSHGS